MTTDEKLDKVLEDMGDIKTEIAVMNEGNEYYHREVKAHKKVLEGNGLGWGIKSQVRILWALFVGGLGYLGLK